MAWEKKACNFSDHYCSQPCSVETTAAVHPSPVTDKEYDLKSAEVMFYGAIPGDGFKPISEPSQATAYNGQLQKEAELYGFVTLVTTDDKSAPPVDYVAEKNIPVGEVIAGLTGLAMTYHFDLDDAGDRDQQWQLFRKHSTGVDVLDFTNVMEAGHAGWGVTRRALLIPTHSSLGARFPPPPTGQTANAKLIAHPTLALELSSPLQKHQTVVPGTFVVVSLREIKLHEPIYVDHTTSSDGVMVDGVASTAEATSLAELQKVCRLREIQLVDEIVNDLAHWNPAHKSTVTASKAKRKLDLGTVRQHVWPGDNSINTLTGSPEAADEALIRQAVAAMQRSLPLVSFLKEASPLAATCLQQLDTIQFYDVQRYCSAENKGSDAADKKRTGRASGRGEVDWTVDQYREWVRQSHVGFLRVRTISGLLPVLPSMDFDLRIRSLRDKQSSELAAAAKLSPEDEASMDDSAKQAASEKLQAALAAKRTLCDANYTALLKTIKTENGPWLKRLAAFNKYYEKLTGVVRASSSSAVGVSAIASWAKQWSAWTADVGWNTLVEEWKEHIQTPLSLPRLTGYFGSIKNSSPRPDPEVLKDIWIPVKDLVDEADQPALDSDLLEFPLGAFFRLGKLDAISLESLESFLVVLEYVLRDRKGLLSSFLKREDKCIFDACPGLTGAGVLWHIARMATNLMSAIRVAKAEKADGE
jgi:hypothetical protein